MGQPAVDMESVRAEICNSLDATTAITRRRESMTKEQIAKQVREEFDLSWDQTTPGVKKALIDMRFALHEKQSQLDEIKRQIEERKQAFSSVEGDATINAQISGRIMEADAILALFPASTHEQQPKKEGE